MKKGKEMKIKKLRSKNIFLHLRGQTSAQILSVKQLGFSIYNSVCSGNANASSTTAKGTDGHTSTQTESVLDRLCVCWLK